MISCEECDKRFRCYLTKRQPTRVSSISCRMASYCAVCKFCDSEGPERGKCSLNGSLILWNSVCDNFELRDETARKLFIKTLCDLLEEQMVTRNLPRICVVAESLPP